MKSALPAAGLAVAVAACIAPRPAPPEHGAITVTPAREPGPAVPEPAGGAEPIPAAGGREPLPPRVPADDGPAPDDPLEFVYARRLSFAGGEPAVTVRVAEGLREFAFVPRGPLRARARAPSRWISGPSGGTWKVRLQPGAAPITTVFPQVALLPYGDDVGQARLVAEWAARGIALRSVQVGAVYGVAGRVVDTRRTALLVEGEGGGSGGAEWARAKAAELAEKFGVRPELYHELSRRPGGLVELVSPDGEVVAASEGALEISAGVEGITVLRVQHSMGYAQEGFEDRTYRGRVIAVVDASGALAAVNAVPLETLLRGIVPSEIFARAPAEALKAQALAARGEILAKIGARHMGDPYMVCAEQHCQVYKGAAAEHPATDAAVEATRGLVVVARGRVVDTVYSAVCGGHTEDNDAVWGGPPDPVLRGAPDFEPEGRWQAFAEGVPEDTLATFLRDPPPAACAASSFLSPDKFRWERRFGAEELDALAAPLNVGAVRALRVEGRGVSGRARVLAVEGDRATVRVYSELSIRRLFKNLQSGMFTVARENGEWVFRGGGWGHGVGLCQQGAIGRAEHGEKFEAILKHYYRGASIERLY